MRQLTDVINQILKVSTNKSLNNSLEKIKYDITYTAPEAMYIRWNEVAQVLNTYAPNPLESDETLKIASIFTGLTEDEIKKRFAQN